MKHLLLSLRMILFLSFLSCITQPLHAYTTTISNGLYFEVNYTGERATAVGTSASCFGVEEDFVGDVNIPSVIGATLVYEDGKDSEGKPIYSYYHISAPVTGVTSSDHVNYHDIKFKFRTGIKSVRIPSSVQVIAGHAFSGCTGLTSVIIDNAPASIAAEAFKGCTSLTNVSLGNAVTSIGQYAFYNCSSITETIIPNTCTYIDDYAFSGCSSLKEINIPNTCKRIGKYAFYGCSSITEINIPNTCGFIDDYAFANTGLTSIFIPENLEYFGFESTHFLSMINGNGTPIAGCDISKIEVHKDSQWFNFYWDEYDNRKDYGDCNAIIGWDKDWNPELLVGCKTTIFPNTVTTIGYAAFMGQPITDITIPASINKIGAYAFYGCIGLKNITCLAATPPTIVQQDEYPLDNWYNEDYFDELEYIFYAPFYCQFGHYDENDNFIYELPASYILENATLYVPKESLALYQTTIPWKYFVNIVGIDTAIPGDVDGDGKVNIDDVTTLINHLLKGSTSVSDGADVNEDGKINIEDVTTLINKLLHGH